MSILMYYYLNYTFLVFNQNIFNTMRRRKIKFSKPKKKEEGVIGAEAVVGI